MKKHLWEIEHPYYCNEGNYYSCDCSQHYKSWTAFIEEEGDSDFDLNLVFRWDWQFLDEEKTSKKQQLKVFWVNQRKGIFRSSTVDVCKDNEDSVREWLNPRLKHLIKLWEPLIRLH